MSSLARTYQGIARVGTGLGNEDEMVVAVSWVLGRRHLDIFSLFGVHGEQLGLKL